MTPEPVVKADDTEAVRELIASLAEGDVLRIAADHNGRAWTIEGAVWLSPYGWCVGELVVLGDTSTLIESTVSMQVLSRAERRPDWADDSHVIATIAFDSGEKARALLRRHGDGFWSVYGLFPRATADLRDVVRLTPDQLAALNPEKEVTP